MSDAIPSRADVIVIGGGIAGLSALYHLALEGVTNTVLLERRQLACGTTWHSVGSVGQVRGSRLLTLLSSRTAEMLRELERETGMSTGYKQYGSIAIALNEERLEEFRRTVSAAAAWGHEASMLSYGEIKERCPHAATEDALGGLFLPGDGRTNPVDTAQALARACRQRGARIFEETKVEEIVVEDGAFRGVRTARGEILAEKALLATGMWSRDLAESIGVHVPLCAAEHFYAVTEPIPGLPRDTPMLRVPDESTYYKEDAGKLLFGCLEEVAKPWGLDGVPDSFCFDSLPPDLDHFAPILETAMKRMPILNEVGVQLFFNGPESFTPDGEFHLGETAEVRGLFVSCGFNTIGVMASGGIGRMAAQLMAHGRSDWDASGVDVRRSTPFETNHRYLAERIAEGLGKLYRVQAPDGAYASARGVRRSPLHAEHVRRNAVMGHAAGWELPMVFAPDGAEPRIEPSFRPGPWRDWSRAELEAAASGAAILDQSPLAKLAIAGPDADALAAGLFTRAPDLQRPAARGLLLDDAGGVLAIAQLVRLAPDLTLVIAPIGDERRLKSLLSRRTPDGLRAAVVDATAQHAIVDLFGSDAEPTLRRAGFRERPAAGGASEVDLGLAHGRRVSGGEHGVDCVRLVVPGEASAHVYERLLEAGATPMGRHAFKSRRIESGAVAWGVEVDATLSPGAAGLAHLAGERADGAGCAMALVTLNDAGELLHGREPIRSGGAILGWVLSGGARLDGRAVGVAALSEPFPIGAAAPLGVEVEIAGEPCPGALRPLPGSRS